jgi:hypothetical protein
MSQNGNYGVVSLRDIKPEDPLVSHLKLLLLISESTRYSQWILPNPSADVIPPMLYPSPT